jgi:hypothetical protein
VDGALYANLMRAINQGGQQTLSSVLDASLLPDDCGAAAPASNGTPAQNVTACQSGVWAQATGDSLQIDGKPGLHSNAFGLLGGVDAPIGDAFHAGLEAGVNQLNGNDALGGRGTVYSAHGGVYAFGDAGPLVLSGTLDGGYQNYEMDRQTGIGHASTRTDGSSYAGGAQVAWPIHSDQWTFIPKTGVLYQHQQLDGFGEVVGSSSPLASAFAVRGQRSTFTTMQPYAGVSFASVVQSGSVIYTPQFDLGYRYDTRGQVPSVTITAQDGTPFALPGNTVGRGEANAGARIMAQSGAWRLSLDYTGTFASHLHDNVLSFGISREF